MLAVTIVRRLGRGQDQGEARGKLGPAVVAHRRRDEVGQRRLAVRVQARAVDLELARRGSRSRSRDIYARAAAARPARLGMRPQGLQGDAAGAPGWRDRRRRDRRAELSPSPSPLREVEHDRGVGTARRRAAAPARGAAAPIPGRPCETSKPTRRPSRSQAVATGRTMSAKRVVGVWNRSAWTWNSSAASAAAALAASACDRSARLAPNPTRPRTA